MLQAAGFDLRCFASRFILFGITNGGKNGKYTGDQQP